jgi:hypothetical protein
LSPTPWDRSVTSRPEITRGPPFGIASRGIHGKIEQSKFKLVGISKNRSKRPRQANFQLYGRPERGLQQFGHAANESGHIDRFRL